jgi:hypothetical protein
MKKSSIISYILYNLKRCPENRDNKKELQNKCKNIRLVDGIEI